MPTSDLQTELRTVAEGVVAPPADAVLPAVRRAGQRKIARRRARVIVTSVALIAIVAGATVIATRAGGRSSQVRIERDPAGASLYLEPASLPNGMTLRYARGGDHPQQSAGQGGSPGLERVRRWVRFDETRTKAAGVLDLQWNARTPAGVDPLAGSRGIPVEVRGKRGIYEPGQHWLTWLEQTDRKMFIGAPFELAELQGIADSVVATPEGGYDLDAPAAYEFAGEWPGMSSFGTNERQATYGDPRGGLLRVDIADDSTAPPAMALAQADARIVDVRGHRAVVTSTAFGGLGTSHGDPFMGHDPELRVAWLERDNVAVSVLGYRVERETLLAFARSLRAVDEGRWAQLVASTGQLFVSNATIPPTQTTVDTTGWRTVDYHEFRVKVPDDWSVQQDTCSGVANTLTLGTRDRACAAASDGDWITLEPIDPTYTNAIEPCEHVFDERGVGCQIEADRTETWFINGIDVVLKVHSAATGSRIPGIRKFWGYVDSTRPEVHEEAIPMRGADVVGEFVTAFLTCSEPTLRMHAAPALHVSCVKPAAGVTVPHVTGSGIHGIEGTRIRFDADASVDPGKRRFVMQVEYRWFAAERRSRMVVTAFAEK